MKTHNQQSLPDGNGEYKDTFEYASPRILHTDRDLNVKGRFTVNDIETKSYHGQKERLRIIVAGFDTTIYTELEDYGLAINSVAATSPTILLPKAPIAGIGKVYVVKDFSGDAQATTIVVRAGGEATIDGATTNSVDTDYGVKKYISNGTNWFTWT